MKTLLIAIVIAECAVLLLLSLLKKLTKRAFTVISAVTLLCCVGILAFWGRKEAASDSVDERAHVYMAARLAEEGYYDEAVEVLSDVSDETAAQLGAQPVRALSYNMGEAYHAAEASLNAEDGGELARAVLEASRSGEPVAEADRARILSEALSAVAASEAEARQWETEMRVRFMGFAPSAEEQSALSDTVARIKAAVADRRFQDAWQLAAAQASRGNVKAAILVSKLYADQSVQGSMTDADSAYADLWQEAAALRADLNAASAGADASGDAAEDYELLKARYELALEALNDEAVSRSVNYLNSFDVSGSSDRLGYQLQLARLYYMENRQDEARELLRGIFASDETDESLWLGRDVALFREAYIRSLSDPGSSEYSSLFDRLMRSLYQSVYDDASDEGFRTFVLSCMKDFFGGISIRQVGTADFPQVSLEVYATNPDLTLDADRLTLTDTGRPVEGLTVTANEVKDLSVAIVLDKSGSMAGDNISESQAAIRNCISQMGEQVAFSLVSFNNAATLESGLTKSYYTVMSLVDQIDASGGTNICYGLSTAMESLVQAEGNRVIILLSDGIDFPESKMKIDSVLADAAARDITVYTIGLEGCDETYLRRIAESTGGTFIMVTDPALLQQTYQDIQSMIMDSYTIAYRAEGDEEDRSVQVQLTDTVTEARKEYSLSETEQRSTYYANGLQEADYFRQTGGTDIGRG